MDGVVYEYLFAYVGRTQSIQELLDAGWEPVPHTVPVQSIKGGLTDTHVWLRRSVIA